MFNSNNNNAEQSALQMPTLTNYVGAFSTT